MKKFICIIVVFLIVQACEKEDQKVSVRYEVSNAWADTEVSYRTGDEQLIKEWIAFESGEDQWIFGMELNPGEIVYLSAMYTDSASSVKIRILIDGKIYKEGSSNNEPDKYLTVSGVVPY